MISVLFITLMVEMGNVYRKGLEYVFHVVVPDWDQFDEKEFKLSRSHGNELHRLLPLGYTKPFSLFVVSEAVSFSLMLPVLGSSAAKLHLHFGLLYECNVSKL